MAIEELAEIGHHLGHGGGAGKAALQAHTGNGSAVVQTGLRRGKLTVTWPLFRSASTEQRSQSASGRERSPPGQVAGRVINTAARPRSSQRKSLQCQLQPEAGRSRACWVMAMHGAAGGCAMTAEVWHAHLVCIHAAGCVLAATPGLC